MTTTKKTDRATRQRFNRMAGIAQGIVDSLHDLHDPSLAATASLTAAHAIAVQAKIAVDDLCSRLHELDTMRLASDATDALRDLARDLYANGSDDNVEVDDDARISSTTDGHAWVQAWVRVPFDREV